MKRILFFFISISIIVQLILPTTVFAHDIVSTYDQEHFWFRDDDGSESAATGYGTGNLAVDASIVAGETFAVGQAFRLRFGLLKNNNGDVSLTVTPKLQFKAGGTSGSCTTNTWTDVPTQTTGGQAFTQATSPNFTDGTATTRQLDAVHTLRGGDMIEIDGSPNSATFTTGNNTDHAEWEWMLDSDAAAESTVYTFRIVHSTGTVFDLYTQCPTLETDAPPGAPTVTTNAATNVAVRSATLNGEITATGGSNATVRGFAWGTDSTLSTTIATTTESGDFGVGTFSKGVSGLFSGVTYYFRAYATNPTGTGYGTILNFTTTTDTTPSRKIRLFEGFRIKFLNGKIIINQK